MSEKIPVTEGELRLLEALAKLGKASLEEAAREAGLSLSSAASYAESLKEKGLVRISERRVLEFKPTEEGIERAEKGLPELRVVEFVKSRGGRVELSELREALGSDAGLGLGQARRRGWIRIDKGAVELTAAPEEKPEEQRILKELARAGALQLEVDDPRIGVLRELVRRKLATCEERAHREVELALPWSEVKDRLSVEVSRLTPELIRTGAWRHIRLREYNVEAEPPRLYPGRKHFYAEFIKMIREIMASMGFEEWEGPYVELELWNFDVLFQAQDHPAREVHDTFRIAEPKIGRSDGLEEVLRRVKEVHETGASTGSKGWRYTWRQDIALRLVLRSQTTSVTARAIAANPEPPLRVFCLSKVFRPDVIDAKHLPEFHQLDGIVMEKGTTFRTLLGVLTEFFKRLGIEKVKFKPGYFPFTEPSVEGYVYIEGLGWVEVFGAGMFRPEVLYALGAKAPVAAWGLGLDRLAMLLLGIDDIRHLYSNDLGFLRSTPLPWRRMPCPY